MKLFRKLTIRTFRRQLASIDSVPQFAILGIVSGFVTGLVIIVFRLLIEYPLTFFLGDSESFEALAPLHAFLLPVLGALVLVPLLHFLSDADRRVGVVHVLERLARHQGHLPLKNTLVQFVTGIIALATGQSGGREGPAIHLGAAGSALIGRRLALPNNSIRVLVGCGSAAAISASFNTPIAGVIFSMEVILMEYTIAGFIPVILASVVAAVMTHLVFSSDTAFNVPAVSMNSLHDIPVLLMEGVFIGAIAALFVRLVMLIHRMAPQSFSIRLIIAGTVTGALALIAPEVLGIGYDTVNLALVGEVGIALLLITFVLKIIASSTTIALGMPVGIIGPTLFIGAMAGGIFALSANQMGTGFSDDALYVTLGMGAMMGAVLQAPLAALMAVLELTNNPNIIMPAMLVIIIANLTASQVFGLRSVFQMQMEMMGLEFRQNPLSMALNRASVASIMARSFERVNRDISLQEAKDLERIHPLWLLVDVEGKPKFLMPTEDLTRYLATLESGDKTQTTINLEAIPASRRDVTSVLLQATLSEAMDALNQSGTQAVYVNRISGPLMDSPVGIVTREDIESYYRS